MDITSLQHLIAQHKLSLQQTQGYQQQTCNQLEKLLRELTELNSQYKTKQSELAMEKEKLAVREKEVSQLEQTIKDQFKEREKELDERQQQLDEITDKLHKTTTISGKNQKVKLRVGEKQFFTSLDTLTTEKDTYFSGLLSEHFGTEVDEDGEIFIDRDPTHFRLILNHLRGMDVTGNINELSENQKKELQQEIDFYQIESMFQIAGFPSKVQGHQHFTWDNGTATVEVTSTSDWKSFFASQCLTEQMNSFSVKIEDHIPSTNSWGYILGIITNNPRVTGYYLGRDINSWGLVGRTGKKKFTIQVDWITLM